MRKTIIIALLFATSSTFLQAQRFNLITEGLMSNDALSELAFYKNDLDKLELKGKVKTLTIKGTFQESPINDIYTFNPEGKLSLITTPGETTTHTFTYTPDGYLKTCVTLKKDVPYAGGLRDNEFKTTFNHQNGRLISCQDPFNTITKYIYNAQGELTQIGEDDSAILFNNKGQVTRLSSERIEYTYDSTGKLQKRTSIESGMDDISKITSTYTYNPQGDVVKAAILTQNHEEVYAEGGSKLGKLTGTHRRQENYSYIYDAKGNWTKLTGSNKANLTRRIEYYPE